MRTYLQHIADTGELHLVMTDYYLGLHDGAAVQLPLRAILQQQDDDWRTFRDSPFGQALLSADLSTKDE